MNEKEFLDYITMSFYKSNFSIFAKKFSIRLSFRKTKTNIYGF